MSARVLDVIKIPSTDASSVIKAAKMRGRKQHPAEQTRYFGQYFARQICMSHNSAGVLNRLRADETLDLSGITPDNSPHHR